MSKANRPGRPAFEVRSMREFRHQIGKCEPTPKKKNRQSKKRRQRRRK